MLNCILILRRHYDQCCITLIKTMRSVREFSDIVGRVERNSNVMRSDTGEPAQEDLNHHKQLPSHPGLWCSVAAKAPGFLFSFFKQFVVVSLGEDWYVPWPMPLPSWGTATYLCACREGGRRCIFYSFFYFSHCFLSVQVTRPCLHNLSFYP